MGGGGEPIRKKWEWGLKVVREADASVSNINHKTSALSYRLSNFFSYMYFEEQKDAVTISCNMFELRK